MTRTFDPAEDALALELFQAAVAVPSVTGREMEYARLVERELHQAGADEVHLVEVAPGRPIVWSLTRGSGGGQNLLVIGHLDTVGVDDWAEHWTGEADDLRADPFSGAIVDGAVWGRGTGDVKGGISATLAAMRSLQASGTQLQGDLLTAWVCDEESGEPGLGRSLGMLGLVDVIKRGELPRPDFAVYVEPTGLAVSPAQIGFFVAEIAIEGRSAYFCHPEQGIDALKAGQRLLVELWELEERLQKEATHPLLKPVLLAASMRAGEHLSIPGKCAITVLRCILPGEDLGVAARELEAAIARAVDETGATWHVEYPAGRDHPLGGTAGEIPGDHPAVQQLLDVLGEFAPEKKRVTGFNTWSELPLLAGEFGTPGVYFAAGEIVSCHTPRENVPVDDYLTAFHVLTEFFQRYCNTPR
ncbi:MAG TPA: M20/M25/M40 family metallo-hydrolase [Jatrophihabitans sp.]|nr:M20/M25/M40 family metallo-hydrolase [Jatrophihabitans sp.]